MAYLLSSILTWSYWRYAVFSFAAAKTWLGAVGAMWLFVEVLDFFGAYTRDKYSVAAIPIVCIVAFLYVLATRRPVKRVAYNIPGRELRVEVRIADLLSIQDANVVVSSNTTFDTDISNGLIAQNSLQGQFLVRFFSANHDELDRQIRESLKGKPSTPDPTKKGNQHVYNMGTVARVRAHGQDFLFLAMSHLNEHGNASSSVAEIDTALAKLWEYMATQAERKDVAIPVLGTGRGRVGMTRKKMIERIAQSFLEASRDRIFANRLIIVVHPTDAASFSVNLFEVRDYLMHSLHL